MALFVVTNLILHIKLLTEGRTFRKIT